MKPDIESLVTHKDFDELDSFADTQPRSSIFQTGRVARVYLQSPDTRPLALVARGPSGEIVASAAGVTFSHSRHPSSLVHRLSRHFTIRGAPLGRPTPPTRDATTKLLRELPTRMDPNTIYVRCYPEKEGPAVESLNACGYAREDWLNIILDLTIGERKLFEGMSKHRRKGVRAAERAGLGVTHVSTSGELDALYGLLADGHRRLRIPLQDRCLFEAVFRDMVPRGDALMLLATCGDETLATRVVLLYRGTAYDWYAASTLRAKQIHADEWLTWKAMILAGERGATEFDFGGAGKPDEEYGPREFKRRFGGRITNVGRYTRVLRPLQFRIAGLARDVLGRL